MATNDVLQRAFACSLFCTFQILEESKIIMACLDVANGYSEHFVNFVRRVREKFPKHTIIAGNVVTGHRISHLYPLLFFASHSSPNPISLRSH